MTRNRAALIALPSQLLMAAFVTLFFAYVDLHLYYSSWLPVPAAYVFLALLAAFGGLPLLRAAVSPAAKSEVLALYIAHRWILAALAAIAVVTFAFAFLPGAYWADGPQYLLFPLYDSLIVVLSMLLPVLHHHRRRFGTYIWGAFLLFLASVLVDVASPGTFSLIPDRAAGFGDNPNTAAFVLVLLCGCLLDFERLRAGSLVVLALSAVGVLATLSRGGAIMLAVTFAFYLYHMVRAHRARPVQLVKTAGGIAVLVATTVGIAAIVIGQGDMFALSYQPRLGMLDGSQQIVGADDDRLTVLASYVDELVESPVLGYGTGYSYSLEIGPHNIYMQQWINNGLPGLAAYCLLLAACASTFWRRGSSRGLLFIAIVFIYGWFNHNILEERAFLALLGVLLTVSFYGDDLVTAPAPSPAAAPERTLRRRILI